MLGELDGDAAVLRLDSVLAAAKAYAADLAA
jgi:hypothetical protein